MKVYVLVYDRKGFQGFRQCMFFNNKQSAQEYVDTFKSNIANYEILQCDKPEYFHVIE